MDFLNASLQTLKIYCQSNGIVPEGNKTLKATWRDAAIAFYQSTIEPTLGELFAEADRIGTKYQDPEEVLSTAIELAQLTQDIMGKAGETTKTIAVKAVKIATSERAIEAYRRMAYLAALLVVMAICTVMAIGRMVLEHERTQTAIGAVKVKAVEFARFIRSRAVAFWDWIRSIVPNTLIMAGLSHLDLME